MNSSKILEISLIKKPEFRLDLSNIKWDHFFEDSISEKTSDATVLDGSRKKPFDEFFSVKQDDKNYYDFHAEYQDKLEEILKNKTYETRMASSADTSSPGTMPSYGLEEGLDPSQTQLRTSSEVYSSIEMDYQPETAVDATMDLGMNLGAGRPQSSPGNYRLIPTNKLHLVSFAGIEIFPEDDFTSPEPYGNEDEFGRQIGVVLVLFVHARTRVGSRALSLALSRAGGRTDGRACGWRTSGAGIHDQGV